MNLSEKQLQGLRSDRNMVVSAGAGAGKTSVLTERYLRLLDSGIHPSKILCLTFTKKAAEEMRFRISKELLSSAKNSAGWEKAKYKELIAEIARSPIVTFDSLFLSIYHDYAAIYWQNPKLTIIDQVTKTTLIEQIINKLNKNLTDYSFSKKDCLFGGSPISALTETITQLYNMDRYDRTIDVIKELVLGKTDRSLLAYYDFQFRIQETGCIILSNIYEWISESNIDQHREFMTKFNSAVFQYFGDHTISQTVDHFLLNEIHQLILHHRSNHLADENILSEFFNFAAEYKGLKTDHAVVKRSGQFRFYMSHLINAILSEYQISKNAMSLADYHDVQNYVNIMMQQNRELRDHVSTVYDHVLIDEFQDTNFSQWEIIRPFVWDEENSRLQKDKLFIVGDPKQSIFKFNNAQVEIFQYLENLAIKSNKIHHSDNSDKEDEGVINLAENFRACESVLEFINATFDREFSIDITGKESLLQVAYQPMDYAKKFEDEAYQSGWVKMVDYSGGDKEQATVDSLLELLEKLNNKEIPFDQSNDKVAVIASKNKNLKSISGKLKRIGLSHQLYKTDNVLTTQEGIDCKNMVRFLSEPENDIACLSVLKSPLFMIKDEIFLVIKNGSDGKSLFESIQKNEFDQLLIDTREKTKIALFKHYSKIWLDRLVNEKVSHILWDALTETGAWSLYREFFNPDVVIKNIESIIDHINSFESDHSRTIHDVVQYLESLAYEESGLNEITAVSGTESNIAVDLLTVHKSKGLTYKYVIVLNTFDDRAKSQTEPFIDDHLLGIAFKAPVKSSWIETEYYKLLKTRNASELDAEKNRLVYVALTRSTHGMMVLYDGTIKDSDKKKNSNDQKRTWNQRFIELIPVYQKIKNVGLTTYLPKSQNRINPTWTDTENLTGKNESGEFIKYIQSLHPPKLEPDSYFTNFTATGLMAANQCGTLNRFKKMSIYLSGNKSKQIFPSALKGTIVHELMACHRDEKRESAVWRKFKNIPEEIRSEIKKSVRDMWSHSEIVEYAKLESKHELSFFTSIQNRFIQGSIDWLIFNKNEAVILDFKSNRISKSEIEKLYNQYELQLKLYALSVAKIYPDIGRFKLSIFSTHVLTSFSRTFSRREIIDFEPALFHIISRIEAKSFDRNFKETDHLLCTDCAFHSYCYPAET